MRPVLFIFASFVFLCACQKEFHLLNDDLPLNEAEQDIMASSPVFVAHQAGDVLYSLKKSPRKVRLYVGDSLMVYSSGGGGFIFRPYIFMKKDSTVVQGFVDLYITDVVSYGDMIYNGLSTIASDTLLESRGMIDVVAVQGNDTLLLRPGATIDIWMPETFSPGLRLFTGQIHATAENSVTWNGSSGTAEPASTGTWMKGVDTLTWTNVAKPVSATGTGSLYATLPAGFNASNSLAYVLLDPGKTIFNLTEDNNGVFSDGPLLEVPAGLTAKVVVVSKANNKYYFSEKSITTGATDTIRFTTLTELNINQLHVKLEAL